MGNTYPAALSRNTRNTLIYSDAISAVWSWWDLIADPSYALREDLDIWEVAQRDPKVYQAIQQRLNAIAGREWRVMPRGNSKSPAAKAKANILDAMLRRVPHFQDARRRLAQSVFRGQASELICGRREFVSLADKPSMLWWCCTGLKHIDPRRFVIRPVREPRKDGTVKIRGQLYMSVIPTYQSIPVGRVPEAGGMSGQFDRQKSKKGRDQLWYGRYVPVEHPEWFVRIVYDDEEARLGYGRGLMDAVYFYLWVKSIVWREGLQGLERFVHGVPVLTLDPGKRGATDQASETIRDTALSKLKIMRAGHGYAINAGETLDFKEPGGTGHQMVMGFLEYIDRSLMAVITGASLKSGGDSKETGSYASDAVGMEVSDNVVQYDRDKIDEDIGLDLIGLLCKLNKPQFEALGKLLKMPGLADEPDPVFVTVVKKKLDPLAMIQVLQGAQQIKGMDILRTEAYEPLGLSIPEEDEDVFKGGAAIPQEPQVDPATGEPLPPGMPEPDLDPNEEEDDDFPELSFGAGSPEDDETLFQDGAAPEPDGGFIAEETGDDEIPEPEEVMPELELTADEREGEPAEEVDGIQQEPEPVEENNDADDEPGPEPEPVDEPREEPARELDAGGSDLEKVAEAAARKAVEAVKGGPSDSVEIEGMEKQRKIAKGGK